MKKLANKRIIKYFIGGAIALIISCVLTFVYMPKASAATSTIDSLTLANINSGNAQGQYGNFSWDNSKLKSVSPSEITTDRSKDPFCIVWTRPSNGSYASALNFSVNVVDSVGAITIRYDDDTVPSYVSPGEKQSGKLTENVNSLYSKYEKIYFYISCSYMYNDVKLTSVSIQIKATTYAISFTKGNGLKDAFLSTNNNATSGSASGTAFAKFETVYCFVKLDKGFKAPNGWTLTSGTANSEDAIYRVGSKSVSEAYNFGTFNATAKTASIYRYGNGASNLGYLYLTYGSSAELGTPTRAGYEFIGWNTAQNGAGNSLPNSLTAEEVNAIIDAGTPTYVYAQWSINAEGVDYLIGSIGQVSYTSNSKSKIDAARSAYNSLDSEEQALVTQYDTLTAAEATYAKLKADNEAADDVDALINAIGDVKYPSSKTAIEAAREAYEALTDEQKALVDNYDTLTAAEAKYIELADKAAAKAVDDLINAIGEVEYTDACKEKIDAARDAYEALTDEQKALVDNYDTLTAAEAKYIELADKAAAKAVDDLIDAIGEVEYTTESIGKIDAAREAYEALTETQKALVTKKQALEDASDKMAASFVDYLIEEIDSISEMVYPTSGINISVARQTYEALTETQKALVTKYDDLVAAESKYNDLCDQDMANSVKALITAIGDVKYPSSKAAIEAAREAYEALTETQKALVTNYKELTDAEKKYDELELAATRHSLDDKEKGVKIETGDGTGIPRTITLKVEVKATVSATEGTAAHDNILNMINGYHISGVYDVKLIQTVDGVEKEVQPSEIKDGIKIVIHLAIPEGVNPEQAKILHIHSENDIEYVENAQVVEKEFVFEVSKLSEFAIVTPTTGLLGWAIALIIIGSLLLVCGVCYVLLFFVFNKWVNKNGKAVRAFKIGSKDDKVRVITMPCMFESYDKVFNNKSEVLANKELKTESEAKNN